MILATHCWAVTIRVYPEQYSVVPELKVLADWIETLFHGSTLLFAFISGLLFSLVLKHRGWSRFFRSKFRFVFLPFLIATILYTLYHWQVTHYEVFAQQAGWQGYFESVAYNLVTGMAHFHLWYMPVLLIIFALTPAFHALLNTNKGRVLLVLLLVAPLFVSRVYPDLSWKTVVYFSAAYVWGMWFGRNYAANLQVLRKWYWPLSVAFVVSTVGLYWLYQQNINDYAGISLIESATYVQKMLTTLLLIVWIEKASEYLPHWLNTVADYGFAIYFVHGAVLTHWLIVAKQQHWLTDNPYQMFMFGALTMLVVTSLSLLYGIGARRVFGRRARMLTGS